jgi:hypothetical protein
VYIFEDIFLLHIPQLHILLLKLNLLLPQFMLCIILVQLSPFDVILSLIDVIHYAGGTNNVSCVSLAVDVVIVVERGWNV